MNWKSAEVAVLGLGSSNLALIRYLVDRGCRPVGRDKKSAAQLGDYFEQARNLGIDLVLGPGYLEGLGDYDVVFITPGMRKDLPEIDDARRNGAIIGCEMQLFFEICEAPIIGITGSSGKTTTTSLVGEILKGAGFRVHVGGNIGTPLIDRVESIDRSDHVVLELSSFQLELMESSPSIGVVTNVTPNHLDAHPSMEAYMDAKRRIYLSGSGSTMGIFNHDNDVTRQMASEARSLGIPIAEFGMKKEFEKGAYLEDGWICYGAAGSETRVCRASELKLLGSHNVENALAATAVAAACGAGFDPVARVLRTFAGVEHRLQLVGSANGIDFYNDSIATTPARARAGILSFEASVVLIAGGYDKHLGFDELARVICDRVRVLVLLGATADKIERCVREHCADTGGSDGRLPEIVRARDFESAVQSAASHAKPGEVVLLSPACASYDMFKNFEERGHKFAEIIGRITGGEQQLVNPNQQLQ